MPLEAVNQRLFVIIVYLDDLDSRGKLALAPGASDGSNGMFPSLEKLLGNVFANLASSLMDVLLASHPICAAE